MEKKETIRLTIDFPVEQHIYIKMLAAREGLSLRQYVIDHLPGPTKKSVNKRSSRTKRAAKGEFEQVLDEIVTEYEGELQRLAKR